MTKLYPTPGAIPPYENPNPMPKKESILQEADRIINGARADQYGGAEDNFQRIADLWNGHLAGRKPGPLDPHDVALMMILMKVARLQHSPGHRDSVVDIAGYAGCIEKMWEGR